MNAGTKLGLFGLLLIAMLGAGALVGEVAGPIEVDSSPDHDAEDEATGTAALPAGGLLVSQDGYGFEPEHRTLAAGEFAFAITGPDGAPVESYELLHDRELHLIVASRDLQHYLHVHPERDGDGRWSIDLPALPPGPYRAFADFHPRGSDQYTLGIDLTVVGQPPLAAPLVPTAADEVDGYEVALERDEGGHGSEVTVTVRQRGQVVTTEPYLGAAGHLVALRDGDLAYLHVHPLDDEPSGPVRFAVEVPSAGTYALFFDFQVDGVVRSARFVIDADAPPAAAAHGGESEH